MRSVSFGKYHSVFYYNGRNMHSSSLGGVCTMIMMITLLLYVGVTMVNIFNTSHFNLDTTAKQITSLMTSIDL